MAGLINPNNSLTIRGIVKARLNKKDTYIWANRDCPGAVWINFTPEGSKLWLKKRIVSLEIFV
jgi:hypothetical protein